MNNLKTLSIKGFQSHRDTELEFHPGFNVIVGTNNSGKTAIVRALRKVCYDEPAGADFVNDGMTECEICITLDNGTITRKVQVKRDEDGYATLGTHSYEVNGETFTAFGRKVPDAVLETHGMRVLDFKGSGPSLDLNFQGQQDPPFLLFGTSSARAKALSLVSGIEITDQGVAEINRRIRSLAGKVKADLVHIGEMEASTKELPDKKTVEQYREQIPKVMDDATALGKEVLFYVEGLQTLKESSEIVAQYKDLVISLQQALRAIGSVEDGCENVAKDLEKLQELLDDYEEALEGVGAAEVDVEELTGRRDAAAEEILKLLDEIDVCPTCGQELDDEHKQHL